MNGNCLKHLVYGTIEERGDELIFIPKEQAEELALIHEAKDSATTWRELYERIPNDVFDRLVMVEFNLDAGFDKLTTEEQQRILTQPFEVSEIALIKEGNWLDWPQQDMLVWVPEDVQDRFGRIISTGLNGEYLGLAAQETDAIVAALEAQGYTCIPDIALVRKASDY